MANCGQVFHQVVLEHFPVMMDAYWHYDLIITSHGGKKERTGADASKIFLFATLQWRSVIHVADRRTTTGIRSSPTAGLSQLLERDKLVLVTCCFGCLLVSVRG